MHAQCKNVHSSLLDAKLNHSVATYFKSFSELFCCSALARAKATLEVRPLLPRLQGGTYMHNQ